MMGGGARAAYQVGVLMGISRFYKKQSAIPFQIVCGTSAGAINAVALACMAGDFRNSVRRMYDVWANFRVHHVFRSDLGGIMKTGSKWLAAMMLGGMGKNNPLYLFDRAPLKKLLEKYLDFNMIGEAIAAEHLYALSVTASGYFSGMSVTFYQGHHSITPWERVRRVSCRQPIHLDHLMASSAIPYLFEPVKINREYFGDGSMRMTSPLSAAIHLGAEKILVIGNRMEEVQHHERVSSEYPPSFAQIAGHALNSIFLDSLEADLERIERINQTLGHIEAEKFSNGTVKLKKIDTLLIAPCDDLGDLAKEYFHTLPWAIRYLLRGMGATPKKGSTMLSYLLFEKEYCRCLIRQGLQDALRQKDEVLAFLAD